LRAMLVIRKASGQDVRLLSSLLLKILDDRDSEVYKENIVKFGVPESYARKAFAEDTLLKAITVGRAIFYIALLGDEIAGFAQIIQQNPNTAVLDRIIVFPQHTRKGIGSRLLQKALEDEKRRGVKSVTVQAGKQETHAKRFYEKDGFVKLKDETIAAPWGQKMDLTTYVLQLAQSSSRSIS
jgi:ribosomal protein S18 acetylase RimI-like enzyme